MHPNQNIPVENCAENFKPEVSKAIGYPNPVKVISRQRKETTQK